MRKLFSKTNYSEYYDRAADINEDGKLSVADLVLMNRYLLGRDTVIGSPETTAVDEPDVTNTTESEFFAVYGPPSWFGIETTTAVAPEDDPVTTTENNYASVYGPPSWFGGEDK